MINNRIHRPKWHQQSQIKAHKKSLKKSDKNPESTHNITETCKEYNKTNKYLQDITRTCKKAYKPLTESPKDTTNYNGPGGIKSGLQNYILADKSDQLQEDK